MSMFNHPGRHYRRWDRLIDIPPLGDHEFLFITPEKRVIDMSECKWCDRCDSPFRASDPDAFSYQQEIPKLVGGVKVGVEASIQKDQCGDCTRSSNAVAERRRAISAGEQDAQAKLTDAVRANFADTDDTVSPHAGYRMGERRD